MRAVLQRVPSASVTIEGAVTGEIGRGLVVLLGIEATDTAEDLEWLAGKITGQRIFTDDTDRMNLSVVDSGGADPARWTVASPNCTGTVTLAVRDDQAHTGAHALRVDGGGGYCDHVFIAHSATIESLGPTVYGRFWLRLDAALGQGHVTFMTLRDSADAGGKDLRMGGQSQILMWNRESDDATLPSLSPAGIALSLAPVPQQWTCVEFMIDQDTAQLRTWIDGDELTGLVVDAEPTPDVDQQWHNKPDWKPVLEDIKLGWESYAGQTMVLHVDDIALAGARIGCD